MNKLVTYTAIILFSLFAGYGYRMYHETLHAEKVFYDQQHLKYMEKINSYIPPGCEPKSITKDIRLKEKK